MSTLNRLLSPDSLLLLVVFFPTTYLRDLYIETQWFIVPRTALGVFAVVAYGLAVVYLLLDFLSAHRDTRFARLFVLSLLITTIVVAPTLTSMIVRHRLNEPHHWTHDNPIQIEEAVRFMVRGVNPYRVDYTATPMADWPGYTGPRWSSDPNEQPPPEYRVNPALYHTVSLPFGLLAAVPPYIVSTALLGWFDARWLYLLAYGVTLGLVAALIADETRRLCALIVIALNPLLIPFVIEGRNDILVFSLVFGSAVAWHRGRLDLSGVLLGLAIVTKHIAILFLPFYALLGWNTLLPWRDRILAVARHLAPTLLAALVVLIPFLAWDSQAFLEDTFGYLAGTLPTSYPLSGMGLGGIAVATGLVPNAAAPFPTLALQLVFGAPLLLFLLWRQWRDNKIQVALGGYGLFLLVYMWFARFYFDNYLGYILLVLSVAYIWPTSTSSPAPGTYEPELLADTSPP